jgi:hypothetical protein
MLTLAPVGDDIKIAGEWVGDTQFFAKKHLQGGFIMYWNVLASEKSVQVGLLGPKVYPVLNPIPKTFFFSSFPSSPLFSLL